MQRMLVELTNNAVQGRLVFPNIEKDTFGIKAAVITVSCGQTAAGVRLPAEGYYQLAFAYRIKE
jgi:hypothetical protein